MVEREFNEAGDRAVYEDLNLKEQDRKLIEVISERQRAAIRLLRKQQDERREQNMVAARQEIVMQHNRPRLKPGWDKGGPLPKERSNSSPVEQFRQRTSRSSMF